MASPLVLLALPALALPVPETLPKAAAPAVAERVQLEREAGDDTAIARRLGRVFAAVDDLAAIEARVADGVVTLSGSVPDQAAADRAETIAGRVDGVVTVVNRLERNTATGRDVDSALAEVQADAHRVARSLPLFLVALAVAAAIIVLGFLLAAARPLWGRLFANAFLAELVATTIRFLAILLGVGIGLSMLGASALIGALLGGAGVLGIAIGLAVRDTVDNYISSLLLSLRQPFRAGDHVVIDGHDGRVVRLTSRATVLMTLDGNHLRLPNAMVFKAVMLNFTRNPLRRMVLEIGIGADCAPSAALDAGVRALSALPFLLDELGPGGIVERLDDGPVRLRFFAWVDQRGTDFLKARSAGLVALRRGLLAEGFHLPNPVQRLAIEALPEPAEPAPPVDKEVAVDTSPDLALEAQLASEREHLDMAERDLLDDRRPPE